jgi:RNA polymerase sigma-70 factor (ECF subfamily)
MLVIPLMEIVAQEVEQLGLDPAAFRTFYDEALPRVYGYFLHRTGGSVPVAEDLTQETFLAAVSELRKGRRVESPIPWIFGIARHKLIHHYRRRDRDALPLLSEDALEDETADEQVALARENAVAALAAVPPSQRAALVLRHLEGLSVPEIADALGKSVEAVESLLARGRVAFRRAFAEVAA